MPPQTGVVPLSEYINETNSAHELARIIPSRIKELAGVISELTCRRNRKESTIYQLNPNLSFQVTDVAVEKGVTQDGKEDIIWLGFIGITRDNRNRNPKIGSMSCISVGTGQDNIPELVISPLKRNDQRDGTNQNPYTFVNDPEFSGYTALTGGVDKPRYTENNLRYFVGNIEGMPVEDSAHVLNTLGRIEEEIYKLSGALEIVT